MTVTWGWFWIIMAILSPIWVLVAYAIINWKGLTMINDPTLVTTSWCPICREFVSTSHVHTADESVEIQTASTGYDNSDRHEYVTGYPRLTHPNQCC